ncbi:signal transduction histidine kinase [Streptomyces sp. 3211.6]|uniref:sensor histidine kinase n=1 Tax=Streptomyces sp. 3211.6 TaxID=1938845 RepID=UPI000F2CEFA4|nr:histidine kinase [Streptomyces sp. 3211.6]RKT02521.1 signal transduction histidine kinase [Streptomyces sp. 3211.6]
MDSMIIRTRRAALPAAVVLFAAAVVAVCAGGPVLWWGLPPAVCAFVAGSRPGRGADVLVALAAVLVAAAVAVLLVPQWLGLASMFVGMLLVGAMLPWFAGRFLCQYRALVRAGWERAAQLEREQRLVSEQARLRERTRIAQDMHDLLGHDLSLIALSAGALKLSPGLSEEGRAAAGEIRARAGEAVERLAEVIGVLRGPQESGPGPAADGAAQDADGPGPAALRALVERARGAGLDVRLCVEGEPERADGAAAAGRAAVQRVVQEALTNVAKHAPGHRATVSLRYGERSTHVTVTDGPRPDAGRTARPSGGGGSSGFGLIGLDERVRLAGGTFSCGPEGAGYAVRAVLPHARDSGPAPGRAAGGPAVHGTRLPVAHRTASRRLGRTAAAAVLVPLCSAALLVSAVRAWEAVTARWSVLDPRDYARLTLGQPRAELAAHLPERQTSHRPLVPAPAPPGAVCEFYVPTADLFDDRSGDLYRLCFRAGRLVSADTYEGKDVR